MRMMCSRANPQKNPKNRMLFFAPKARNLAELNKRPKTIQEMKKLQSFVQKKVTQPGESLTASIQQQAKRDESFNDFLKEFKSKHEKDWANIIDLTQEKKEDLLMSKTIQERKDELVMLEEFRRRKNLETFRTKLRDEETEMGIESDSTMPKYEPDPYLKLRRISGPPSKFFAPTGDEIFDPTEFTMLFMETDSVTLVTKLNRINHRRVLVFIGNGSGVISYGKGKGIDYQTAFQNAYMELRKNLIVIDLDEMATMTAPLKARFNDFRLWLYPRASPNYWGSQQLMHMLIYTGVYHVRFVIKSRKKDRYSMIYAFFQCVSKIKKPTQFAELTGQKFMALTYNTPLGRSMVHHEQTSFVKNHSPN